MTDGVSSTGWEQGLVYVPNHGPCKGHLAEVVSTDELFVKVLEGKPDPMTEKVKLTGRVGFIEQPAALVRCRECLRSWVVSQRVEMPEELVAYRPSEDEYQED